MKETQNRVKVVSETCY